jgi:hypothetical protein
LASTFGAQVPQGVEHRTSRHVHDALLGAEPPQLGVAGQLTTEISQSVQRLLDVASDDPAAEGPDGYGLDVVAASGREDEAVALMPVSGIRRDDHVGRGVVRRRVHGI